LVVVDPGVGTERRAIALRTPEGSFVGPDNGVFTYVLAEAETWTAVELTNAEYHLPGVSDTFHGRDLFAPAAAHLAAGVPLEELGRSLTNLSLLPLPRLTVSRNRVEGEVLHADRFGNLITSVGRLWWQEDHLVLVPAFGQRSAPAAEFPASTARVELAERTLTGVHRTYGAVPMGRSLALVGSSGFLEIGVRQGSAAEELGACRGEPVVVTFQ
jgi:S-adenosylmethionine hydrolase